MWAGRQISWVPRVNQHALLEPTHEPIDASGKEALLGVVRAGAMATRQKKVQNDSPRRIHVLATSAWLCLACEPALVSPPQLQRLRVHSPSSHRSIRQIDRACQSHHVCHCIIVRAPHHCLPSLGAKTEHDSNLHDAWIDGAPMLEWRRS